MTILPNFLVIGAPKAGTTTLHYILSQHPDIFMCPVKEVGFFWACGQDVHLMGPGSDKLRNRLVTDLKQYMKLFTGAIGYTAIGESSVRCLASPQAPLNIKMMIPQARLIAMLRQPADRAYSAFSHNVRDGLEPCRDFASAIKQERSGVRDNWEFCRYLNRGFYAASIRKYLKYFDRSQIHINLLDDLIQDPQRLMRQLFTFLRVDPDFQLDLSHRQHNKSGIIRNPTLRLLWTRSNAIRTRIRPLIPARLRHSAFEWVIHDLEKLPFPLDLRAELTEFYRSDILELQDLIQRDLSHWLITE